MNDANLKRAMMAEAALDAFRAQAGLDSFPYTVTDLIGDVGHLCDVKGFDFLELMAKAIGDWKLEQSQPNGIGPRPEVRIKVTP